MNKKHVSFDKKMLVVGFGCIGQAVLTLLLRHINMKPEQVTILTKTTDGAEIAKKLGVNFVVNAVTKTNYLALLDNYLNAGDFLLNLSVDVSSLDLMTYCQQHQVIYLDTCIEPWMGGYVDSNLSPSLRSNYAMREPVMALKKAQSKGPTALVTHGANPGLVSHFVKQALLNMAEDTGVHTAKPKIKTEWAALAHRLGIKAIHIAERDTQITDTPKRAGEFVNTWSIDGFVSEGSQPAELGWGTHERQLPKGGSHHEFGPQCAIYLNRPGAATRVRTWTPKAGSFHGFLITHNESVSIADFLTLKDDDKVVYRPTVHYAYHPCDGAIVSLHELAGNEWQQQKTQRLLFDEIVDGMDELGVLLMGNPKGAYWYGSQLTIHEARKLAPYNNATSLQVASGVLSGVIWVMQHPQMGILEPDEINDYEDLLAIARPYLGQVSGHYTDWTPLTGRANLFPEERDQDPWQFSNVVVG